MQMDPSLGPFALLISILAICSMFAVIGIKKRLDEQTRVLEKILAAVLSTGQLTEQEKTSILKTTEPTRSLKWKRW